MSSRTLPLLQTLPPPVTFHSTESLHRILLPPLAEFLSDLSSAEHLIKLHDILHRYRTPKSYHRIDVHGRLRLYWGRLMLRRGACTDKRERTRGRRRRPCA